MSKFVTWKARTEGIGSAISRQILPPFKFIDSITKDMISAGDGKGLEMLGSLPIIGKLMYWHMGRGKGKRKDLWDIRWSKKKKKLKALNERYEQSKNKFKFKQKHPEWKDYGAMVQKQKEISRRTKRINALKSQEETKIIKKKIERLEKQRQESIKKFLETR